MKFERSVTRNLDVARYLLGVFQEKGEEAFRLQLVKYSLHQLHGGGTAAGGFDRRMSDLAGCLLALLYPREPEKLLRAQAELLQPFLSSTEDWPERVQILAAAAGDFLADFYADQQQDRLSFRVNRMLKDLPEQQLRMLTVDLLAEHFPYNRNYLADKYRQEQGHTLHDALLREKLNRAFRLLTRREEKRTVREIAGRLGFSDAAYFRRLFQERYGFLPSDIL